jgi:hypothetical protein
MEIIITEQEWDIDKVKDYISQYKTKKEFIDSPKYSSIYRFFRKTNDTDKLKELTSDLEGVQKNRDIDYVKNYLSQFNTFEDFRNSPEYKAIHSSIYKKYGPETWAELTCVLEKSKESWTLEKAINYISQFNTYEDFKKSPKWNAVKKYIERSHPGKWKELTSNLEQSRMDWDLEKMKEYASKFDTMYDFENSPMFKSINSFIYKRPNAPEIWKEVTSHLKRKIFKGERKVFDILTGLGYEVIPEKKFTDCKSGKETYRCTRLKFDFYTKDKEGKEICVEFDGKQHFEPYELFGGEERFREQVKNDIIKKQYTRDNNIKLIRISYNDYKNIEDEIKKGLQSSEQLVLSTNYPKLGWNDPLLVSETSKRNEYILTESQIQRIVESQSKILGLKRRFTYEYLNDFIAEAVEDVSGDECNEFDDDIDYAAHVIEYAIDSFISENPQIFSGDESDELANLTYDTIKNMYESELMEDFTQICSDEDDEDMMLEQVEGTDSRIISKLFKLISTQKTLHNTRGELMKVIKNNLPIFGIPENQALYILELYLLNFRKDGDYSDLTKGNFIDPRDMKGKKTANVVSHMYTKAQLPFKGSNLEGFWKDTRDGKIYVVKSYGWYPVYIYKDGKWYENAQRYGKATSKQMYNSQPYRFNDEISSNVYLLSRSEMELMESGWSHESIMKKKKESFRDVKPSTRLSTKKSETWRGYIPQLNIKFRVSSVDETEDKNIVNVDIIDVIKTHQGKQIPTPENYLKGEIPNVTPESIEKEVERKLKENFREYLGPKFGNPDEELITFKFNHLKK